MTDAEIAKERFDAQGFAVDEENKMKFKGISEYIQDKIVNKEKTVAGDMTE